MNTQTQVGLVSTIIPVFNRSQMAIESIQSVLDQTYRPIEIIVVDDGSEVEEAKIIQTFVEHYPEITLIRQDNAGPGAAREHGRQHAKGEFIQYHDSDDLLLPDKFALQVASLRDHADCDVAYGKTATRTDDGEIDYTPLKRTGEKIESLFPASLLSRWWGTSTPLYRRTITDLAGPWLSTINEEDWEYECRIASLETRLCYVDEFVSIKQFHDDHLFFDGSTDKIKLRSRCIAQEKIHQHACDYMARHNGDYTITKQDWLFFSKSVFLLSRQCALVGMESEAADMFDLSIRAIGKKTIQHRLFVLLKQLLGWKGAAKAIQLIGR